MVDFVPKEIEQYCIDKSTRLSDHCQQIEEFTIKNVPYAQMLIGDLEGSFLGFLVSLTQAKRILEIGTYTGFSALAMAERLPEDGELITLDIDEENQIIAKRFWKNSPHGKKIKSILGPALDNINKLEGLFDLIFIDADKSNYLNYLKEALLHLSPQGCIILDNCLWSGRVREAQPQDSDTRAIQQVNQFIVDEPSLEACLLPLRDGVFLVRKKNRV